MSESDDDDHEMGVEFGSIEHVFEAVSYPVTAEELVDQYGDAEIERTSADPISIADLFDGMGDQTFESDEELRQGMLNMMPAESVGRQHYSDRGGSDQDDVDSEEMADDNEQQIEDRGE
ncbi:DUF5789 family protein [Halosimplex salinum]|uniref:DUF5789 family protein n=1 Tax=Halosimplex salinum TaxID=1710538 RepID=UPI000F468CC0|nr:hypothetical protein [Halosimplex salinum]